MRELGSPKQVGRSIGKRRPAPPGSPPPAAARAAMASMAAYRTHVPKGVFVYQSHEAANQDRERWQLAAIRARQRELARK